MSRTRRTPASDFHVRVVGARCQSVRLSQKRQGDILRQLELDRRGFLSEVGEREGRGEEEEGKEEENDGRKVKESK